MRRISSGLYAYLPLLLRVLNKISNVVREEMNATGAQECLLPQLQPASLWQEGALGYLHQSRRHYVCAR